MSTFTASMTNEPVILRGLDLFSTPWLGVVASAFVQMIFVVFLIGVVQGQSAAPAQPSDSPYVVEGNSDTMAYALGRSLQINGTVRNGAIALGGDVIVQGIVEGDVAAIGEIGRAHV